VEAHDEGIASATARANEVFAKLATAVEAATAESPDRPLDVLELTREAGLEIDEAVLERLEIPRLIYPLPWLPWHCWWPYRPLWCWWWNRHYPWYRCCPYWWHCCHPWPLWGS
jgi:hypothetical protein